MTGGLPTHLLVTALLRRVNDTGGMGMVLAKGDAQSGAILALASNAGGAQRFLERRLDLDGNATLVDSTPADGTDDYWRRRRARDPDLWVIELNSPEAERFIAETILDR